MKSKFWFNPAWVIFLMATSTLVALNFMDDEQSRNAVAGIILLLVALLFIGSIILRTLTNRMG